MKRSDLLGYLNATVDDLLGPSTRLLFVGINPGLRTAATGAHFAHPGNRFYPALAEAGITAYRIDASQGYQAPDRAHLLERGVGITNIVARTTAKASDLSTDELRAGAADLEAKVARIQPRVVAVVGISAYRTAFRRPKAAHGLQEESIADIPTFVLGNPSGLNAHETVTSLAYSYAQAARYAGLLDGPPG